MDGNTSKSLLENITMFVDHVQREIRTNSLSFTWDVPGFFRGAHWAEHRNYVKDLNFDLRLKKYKNSFEVTIDTANFDLFVDISCTVSNDKYTSDSIYPEASETDIYKMKCPSDIFKALRSCAREHNSAIKLQFYMPLKDECFYYSGKFTRDYSKCTELRNYASTVKKGVTYFVIKSSSRSKLFCPKSLLAARSKYFRDYFNNPNNNQDETRLKFSNISIATLIYYLYSGILQVFDLKLMLDIYQLACELDVSSLKRRCNREIQSLVNSSTVHLIKSEGGRRNLQFLKDTADEFLVRREEK